MLTPGGEYTINREYKDRLFKFVFGNPENKKWTLSLYNAVNGSSYPESDAEKIQITTINDVVYMSMKNDISFLIGNTMNFYEAQSTLNPNMPMRFLIYAGMVYGNYVDAPEHQINLYSKTQQKFPAPKLVCFYNGQQQAEDETVLSLSSSFDDNVQADIEVKVTMLNINYGRNSELMEKCCQLSDYSLFVDKVRENFKEEQEKGSSKEQSFSNAVSMAIEALPKDSEIRKFLEKNRAEVTGMCLKEYDEERVMNMFKKEGLDEGVAIGLEKGRQEGLDEGVAIGLEKGRQEGLDEGVAIGLEKGRQEGLDEGVAIGLEKGRQEGLQKEKMIKSLMAKLLSAGKVDDAMRVVEDDEYKEKLCREYDITGASE